MAYYVREHTYSVESFLNEKLQDEVLYDALLNITAPEEDYNGIRVWDVLSTDDEQPEILKTLLHNRVMYISEQIEKATNVMTGYSYRQPTYNDWLVRVGVYDENGDELYAEHIVLCD